MQFEGRRARRRVRQEEKRRRRRRWRRRWRRNWGTLRWRSHERSKKRDPGFIIIIFSSSSPLTSTSGWDDHALDPQSWLFTCMILWCFIFYCMLSEGSARIRMRRPDTQDTQSLYVQWWWPYTIQPSSSSWNVPAVHDDRPLLSPWCLWSLSFFSLILPLNLLFALIFNLDPSCFTCCFYLACKGST